jgi:hypothetical protein
MIKIALTALLASVAWPCHAASIEVYQATITIDGDIDFGDFETFQSKTRALSQATVTLRSNGGKLVPAIKIGETIRQKGFATYVHEYCASACTFMWLAGTQRYMAATAQIGFHAAYDDRTGQEGGMANAIVGAYLTKLGLPYEAVIYATVAAPDSMRYLTVADAKRVGIDVNIINTESAFAYNPQLATQQPSLEDQALSFVTYYFATWNSKYYAQVFDDLYWDSVNYYGKMASKADILTDKQRFMARWTTRSYKVRPGTVNAKCDVSECAVTGIFDWEASDQSKRSVGAARFEYLLRPWPLGGAGMDDKLRISAEHGEVLNRQVTDIPTNVERKYP